MVIGGVIFGQSEYGVCLFFLMLKLTPLKALPFASHRERQYNGWKTKS